MALREAIYRLWRYGNLASSLYCFWLFVKHLSRSLDQVSESATEEEVSVMALREAIYRLWRYGNLASSLYCFWLLVKHLSRSLDQVSESATEEEVSSYQVSESPTEEEERKYQVFINHRGPDTKKTLAALFYRYLTAVGVSVFLDQKVKQTGDRNTEAIKGAIRSSYVHIAIFSPRYAESSWCLDELIWMLDRRDNLFIPIFYKVKPSELRHIEKGNYAEAFIKHRTIYKVHEQKLKEWKKALDRAADISGEVFNPEDPSESRDIVQIVEQVMKMVIEKVWMKEPLEVAKHPVGLEQAANEVQNKISNEYEGNRIITVGIVGAGGSGKSTLAKHLYNKKRMEFEKSYLLSVAGGNDRLSSQERLLRSGLLRIEEDSWQHSVLNRHHHLRIEDPSNGKSLLRRLEDHLQGLQGSRRVLIILDELIDSEQVESLSSLMPKLGDGSRVFVTSRDRVLLTRFQVNVPYDIKPLDDTNARDLFCQHAFGPTPLTGFENSVQAVLRICEGLPWALEIFGKDFHRVKDRNLWAEHPEILETKLPDCTKEILDANYMSLDGTEKEVFLDVAHFFEGEDKDLVERVLEGLENRAYLSILKQKCLVEFEDIAVNFHDEIKHGKCLQSEDFYKDQWRRPERCFKINMKRLLADLARQKTREEFDSLPLRLTWTDRPQTPEPNNLSNVRGIRFSNFRGKTVSTEIRGLKFLFLHKSTLPFRILSGVSGELVWLRWYNNTRNQELSGLSLESLRVMELAGEHLANFSVIPNDKPPLELRELTVNFKEISLESASSSSSTRSDIYISSQFNENSTGSFLLCQCGLMSGELKNLVKLVWKNVKGLKGLPFKFEELRKLTHLDLSGWSDLEELPAFTSLKHLQYLALKDCSKLSTVNLGGISTIEYLNFEGCCSFSQLPRGVTTQTSLSYLNLVKTGVQSLTEDFDKLKELEQLFIGSPSLENLGSLNTLVPLRELTLREFSGLHSISQFIDQLTNLEILRILDSEVKVISEGIPWTKIKVLEVVNCPINMLEIERQDQIALRYLKRLSIRGTDISKIFIPDMLCPNIEIIDLSKNAKLKVVEEVPGKLITLNLMDCPTLNTLTCLSNLKLLKFLNISGCGELEFLNVQGLNSIEEIDAAGCWKLQSIPGFGQLQALSNFNISTASKLNTILFPSNMSTAIVSVAASPSSLDRVKVEMDKTFEHVTVYSIAATEDLTSLSVQLRNTSSNCVIVVCLIGERRSDFHIKFGWEDGYSKPFGAKGPQKTLGSEHNTKSHMMHIFMWTEDSEEFKDLKFGGKEVISCTVQAVNPLRGPENSCVPKGAIMMSTKKCDSVGLLQLLCSNCNSRI